MTQYQFNGDPRRALRESIDEGKRILETLNNPTNISETLNQDYLNWKIKTDSIFKDFGKDPQTKNWFQELYLGGYLGNPRATAITIIEETLRHLIPILGNIRCDPDHREAYLSSSP